MIRQTRKAQASRKAHQPSSTLRRSSPATPSRTIMARSQTLTPQRESSSTNLRTNGDPYMDNPVTHSASGHEEPQQPQPDRDFHLFPRLPIELRINIWMFASFHTRDIAISVKCPAMPDLISYFDPFSYITSCAPPAVLHACHESRAKGLEYYKLDFGVADKFGNLTYPFPTRAKTFINWQADRLCFLDPLVFEYEVDDHDPDIFRESVKHLVAKCNENNLQNVAFNIDGVGLQRPDLIRALIRSVPSIRDINLFSISHTLARKAVLEDRAAFLQFKPLEMLVEEFVEGEGGYFNGGNAGEKYNMKQMFQKAHNIDRALDMVGGTIKTMNLIVHLWLVHGFTVDGQHHRNPRIHLSKLVLDCVKPVTKRRSKINREDFGLSRHEELYAIYRGATEYLEGNGDSWGWNWDGGRFTKVEDQVGLLKDVLVYYKDHTVLFTSEEELIVVDKEFWDKKGELKAEDEIPVLDTGSWDLRMEVLGDRKFLNGNAKSVDNGDRM